MKLMVIANCHCLPLADALGFIGRGIKKVDFIDVNFMTQPHIAEKIDFIYNEPDWRVLSFNLSANFERIETPKLQTVLGDRLTRFTNIHFSGLQPDITYVGGMGQRVSSAMGDYHSKIVLFSYVSSRSTEDCLHLFNGNVYEKLGYYKEYENSAKLLIERDESCDVEFAKSFLDMAREIPVLYTINHPTGAVLLALAEKLAASQGLDYASFAPAFFQNHLSNSNIWPIYNELAEYHGLKYRTPQYFAVSKGAEQRLLSRAEFVQKSYEIYADFADQEKLREKVAQMPLYKTFAEIL
jgi:hypothetical protein